MFRTITIALAAALTLAACGSTASPGKITEKHGGLGLKGGSYVTCALAHTEVMVYVEPAKMAALRIGDACPKGKRY